MTRVSGRERPRFLGVRATETSCDFELIGGTKRELNCPVRLDGPGKNWLWSGLAIGVQGSNPGELIELIELIELVRSIGRIEC